ncbi:MAG TPA: alpha/beta hydrolase [Micromonosporaceae bacterium]|nr:alpha/beta hydrolase [Micromonosporaceae bacterium]HCU48709.1 alpha/beta hydrolase [Micromonosporaceae bacterium]
MAIKLNGFGGLLTADVWEPPGPRQGTVLLLHGGGQTRHSWRAAGPMLAEAGWLTYAVDARGHGESFWARDGDYSFDAFADDLVVLVDQLPERPVIIGASLGGITAMLAEGERGGVVKALVLVDIAPRVEPEGVARISAFMTGAPDGFASLAEVAAAVQAYQPHRDRQVNPESMRKNVRQARNGRWYWHWDPAFTAPGRENDVSEQGYRRTKAAAMAIRVPTLLVRGEHSDVVSVDGMDELQSLIPGARTVEVGDARHMVAGDDNAIFLGEVLSFLESHHEVGAADRG